MAGPKPKRSNVGGPMDECYTPAYALTPLAEFLPPGATIWEPCAGSGRLAMALARLGCRVITSTLATGGDVLQVEPAEPYDLVVSNPPFAQKAKVVARMVELGKPWMLILPVEALGAGRILRNFPAADFETIHLTSRVHFEMPEKGDPLIHTDSYEWGDKPGQWIKHQAQFPVMWFGQGVLGVPRVIRDIHYWCELDLVKPVVAPRPALLQVSPGKAKKPKKRKAVLQVSQLDLPVAA